MPIKEVFLSSDWYKPIKDAFCSPIGPFDLHFETSNNDKNELTSHGDVLITRRVSSDGKRKSLPKVIMPDIENVKLVDSNNSKIIMMFFTDGTMEKAVQSAGDVYSFDVGITICLIKKLLSDISGGQGTALYNKLVSRANKIYEKAEECKQKEREENEAAERRYRKFVEKKERKRKQREEETMRTIVDALAAAIVKAREIESRKGD